MARPPASLGSQAPDGDRREANMVTRLSQWADNHLRLVQNISTGMAIVGIMILVRSVRLTSKFTTSSDIPVEFIRKKVKLRGRLHRITECGLEIEHIPIALPFISSWKSQKRAPGLITDGCEPSCGCWELNSGPLEEQVVLLTSEPSLQPRT